jgi:hypothetical protein
MIAARSGETVARPFTKEEKKARMGTIILGPKLFTTL